MPIYEYKCSKCGKESEILHKVSAPIPAECPACKAEGSLERLVSRTTFQLKGGGWYSDLYASTKKSDSSSSGAASSGSSSSTASSSTASSGSSSSSSGSGSSGGSGGTT
ncbi:MAG: FmdB family zinc ribbon protein [Myxococcota bacterium]